MTNRVLESTLHDTSVPTTGMTLRVVTGPMFSGKTDWLLQQWEACDDPTPSRLLIKPRLDTRLGKNAHAIRSRSGKHARATHVIASTAEVPLVGRDTQSVFVDEAQFLPNIASACSKWRALGVDVYIAGLDLTFQNAPFPAMQEVLDIEDAVVHRLFADCARCPSRRAIFSHRTTPSVALIDIGSSEKYEPLCKKCSAATQ